MKYDKLPEQIDGLRHIYETEFKPVIDQLVNLAEFYDIPHAMFFDLDSAADPGLMMSVDGGDSVVIEKLMTTWESMTTDGEENGDE